MLKILLLCACYSPAFASLPPNITDCNNSPNKIIDFEKYHVDTLPLRIPGNLGDLHLQILQPISGNHYKLHVTISKKVLFGWVKMPCFDDISQNVCTFDLCDFLSGTHYNNTHHCPIEVIESSTGFQCACPFGPGQYQFDLNHLSSDHLSSALQTIWQGDFRIHANVVDTDTNEEVASCNIEASINIHECTGIECLIGKK